MNTKPKLSFLGAWRHFAPFARPYRGLAAGFVVVSFAVMAANLVQADLLEDWINAALDRRQGGLVRYALLYGAVLAVDLFATYFQKTLYGRFSARFMHDFRYHTVDHLQRIPPSVMEKHHSGDLLSRLTNDLAAVQEFFGNTVLDAFKQLLMLVAAGAYMAYLNWRLFIVSIFVVPLALIVVNVLMRPMRSYFKKANEALGKANAVARDAFGGIHTVKAFNLQAVLAGKYGVHIDTSLEFDLKGAGVLRWIPPFNILLRAMPTVFCIGYGSFLIIRGELSPGGLVAFNYLLGFVQWPLAFLPDMFNRIKRALGAAERVAGVLDLPAERTDGIDFSAAATTAATVVTAATAATANVAIASTEPPEVLRFDQVSFAYTEGTDVLRDVSFDLRQGETVAIVGASGCGKSTILKLLCGDYETHRGRILVSSHDTREWKLPALRARFAVIAQEVFLFPISVYDNIAYGGNDASREEVAAAALLANAHEFIVQLPEGYDALVGERGIKLSGGQNSGSPWLGLSSKARRFCCSTSPHRPLYRALPEAIQFRRRPGRGARRSRTMTAKPKFKLKSFLQILGYVRPRLRSYLTGLLVFSLTEVSFYVCMPLAMKTMIDAALAKSPAQLWQGIRFILAVSVCGGVSFVLFQYLFVVTVNKLTAALRKDSFGHALALPVPYFEKNHSGDILSRLTNDINALKNSYDWPLWNLLATLFAGAAAAVIMMILDWRVSLFLIGSSLAFTLLNTKFAAVIGKTSAEIQKSLGRITEAMGNILGGFPVIKRFGLEGRLQAQFEVHNRAALDLTRVRIRQAAALDSYNALIGWINFGGVLALGAILAGRRLLPFGTMMALVNLLWNVNRTIREAGGQIAQFQGYLAGAARVDELRREPEEPSGPSAPAAVRQPAADQLAATGQPAADQSAETAATRPALSRDAIIELRNVSFSYDGQRRALAELNLRIDDGQSAALAGPSGGGKSTILKLILGFYRPEAGEILIGGRPIAEFAPKALRDMIAYVPQDTFLFDGTIADNIGCGRTDARMEEIVRAATAANAHEFIVGLERGYDTVVGERGVKLSGGQRQRIAIARAFLKNAPILLLDEATSSLDSRSERLIQDALRELGKRKTVLAVAHRLSTIEDADLIYVIDQGAVAESGKNLELLARGGLYKKLYETQYRTADKN